MAYGCSYVNSFGKLYLKYLRSFTPEEIAFQRAIYDKLIIKSGSAEFRPNAEVAQGSIISPALFDIYTEPTLHILDKIVNSEDIFAYADDIMILCEDLNEVEACLQAIETWSAENNLVINKKKSAILEFIHRRARKTVLKVGGEVNGYPVVDKYKYLGTWLNQKLTLDDQMEHIVKKTYYIRSKLSPSLYNASLDFRKNLWQIFVLLMCEFALPIYAAEEAATKKKKLNILLRASFRSYLSLKKTVKLTLLEDLMGYNLDSRAKRTQYISEQKWLHRQMGTVYNIACDESPIV